MLLTVAEHLPSMCQALGSFPGTLNSDILAHSKAKCYSAIIGIGIIGTKRMLPRAPSCIDVLPNHAKPYKTPEPGAVVGVVMTRKRTCRVSLES